MSYPTPFDEARRQRVLDETGLLDTERSFEFDRLTQLAVEHFGAEIAVVSLVDRDRQWFKSCTGLDADETGRDVAFCAHTVAQDDVFLILDASEDPRFRDNPLVTGAPHIRFYAGAPIVVDGASIGSFCIIDSRPRTSFSEADARYLKAIAHIVANCIEAHRFTEMSRLELKKQVDVVSARLDQQERERTRFLALVSHELRTRLNAVVGFAEVLRGAGCTGLSEDQRADYLDEICAGGERMARLVQSALRFAAADFGHLPLEDEVFRPEAAMDAARRLVSIEAERKNVTVEAVVETDGALKADFTHSSHILSELLFAAVAKSPEGATVRIRAWSREGGAIGFCVSDEGTGFDDPSMVNLTMPFAGDEGYLQRSDEGLGIGLPLASKLARLHGAALTVSNPENGGGRAEVLFPAYRTVPADVAEKDARRRA